MTAMTVALVDTSVWVALEKDRLINRDLMPEVSRVSVVTLAELHAGVLAAPNAIIQTERLRTLERAQAIEPLPIDAAVAREWALLRYEIARAGRRANNNDLWIGATARANGLPVVTQDDDFAILAELGLLDVVTV